MSFDSYGSQKNESNKPTVDYEAINKHVVEVAQLEQPEVLVGYVSVIADLGTQEQADAEVVFTGDEEAERQAVADNPNTYFKDGFDQQTKKQVRLKCWPQKPIQSVAVAVDFPEILVDKGQFFGESNPLPLRLWLGGQFYIPDSGMVVGRPTPLKINKAAGFWSFDKKHLFHKMAVAGKLIKAEEAFLPQDIDKLLGKAFQFTAQIFFKESKGKQHYTENVKFTGALGRGQSEPELLTTPQLVQFNQQNTPEALKELRAHVINTIKRAKNFEGSSIQKQLEDARPVKAAEEAKEEVPEAPKPVARKAVKPKTTESAGSFEDSDIPF